MCTSTSTRCVVTQRAHDDFWSHGLAAGGRSNLLWVALLCCTPGICDTRHERERASQPGQLDISHARADVSRIEHLEQAGVFIGLERRYATYSPSYSMATAWTLFSTLKYETPQLQRRFHI